MIEKEYNKHFDYIIIICLTLRWNKTYHAKDWIKNHNRVWLYRWIERSELLARSETLFIIDDVIADESLDKMTQSLLELAMSGRYRDHYLWLLTQSYCAIPKNLRRQAKSVFVSYPKEKEDIKMIHNENNVLTDDELVFVRGQLKSQNMHAYISQMNILMDLMY